MSLDFNISVNNNFTHTFQHFPVFVITELRISTEDSQQQAFKLYKSYFTSSM